MVRAILIRSVPGCDPRLTKEIRFLVSRGYEVTFLGWDRMGEVAHNATPDDNHTAVLFRLRSVYGHWMLLFHIWLWWAWVFWQVLSRNAEVIHASDLDSYLPALLAAKLKRVGIIYDVYDNFADKIAWIPNALRPMIRCLERFLSQYADCVIIPDENRIDLFRENAKRIEVVRNTPSDIPDLAEPSPCATEKRLVLLMSGALHWNRGLRIIIDVVDDMPAVKVVAAGRVIDDRDRRLIMHSSAVNYLGILSYDNALQLLKEVDVVLALYDPAIPINVNASSNKVFEAMMASKPVIVNKEAAISKLVRAFNCGLTPEYSRQGLKDTITLLLNDHALRKNLGVNGRQAFLANFTWDKMEGILDKLYQDMSQRYGKT